jgi:hypothetical protein
MSALSGLAVVTLAGLTVALGLWTEQGWLAVAGMALLGAAMVVGLAWSRGAAGPPVRATQAHAAASPGDSTFPAAGVAAVSAAGLMVAAGIWQGLNWLTVAGMLLVGVTVVAGLARASSHGRG